MILNPLNLQQLGELKTPLGWMLSMAHTAFIAVQLELLSGPTQVMGEAAASWNESCRKQLEHFSSLMHLFAVDLGKSSSSEADEEPTPVEYPGPPCHFPLDSILMVYAVCMPVTRVTHPRAEQFKMSKWFCLKTTTKHTGKQKEQYILCHSTSPPLT